MCTALENLKREGIQEGRLEGMQEGIREVVETYREVGYPDDVVLSKLMKKFQLSVDGAKAFL